jgi:putative chitinase
MQFEFDKFLPKYGIDTPQRIAAFKAQCHHESQGFTRIEENLNYSADRLMAVWPHRFTPEMAADYAHQPIKIACYVYADRNGNGDKASGDGWRYRGRGLIQLTGKDNYSAFAAFKGMSLAEILAYMETADGCLESACWFWEVRHLNDFADLQDIKGMTMRINRAMEGYKERLALYHQYMEAGLHGAKNDRITIP